MSDNSSKEQEQQKVVSKERKNSSSYAFIAVVVLFAGFYYLFKESINGLSKAWLAIIAIFLIAKIYTFFVIRKKIRLETAEELKLTAEEAQNNKKLKDYAKREASKTFFGELGSYFWVFSLIFMARAFLYEPFKIPSGSMQPTLEIGDFIVVNKHHYKIHDPIFQKTILKRHDVERGDIIVFKSPNHPNEDWIKRVIGKPGDIVHYNEFRQEVYIVSNCKDPEIAAQLIFPAERQYLTAVVPDNVTLEGCKLRETSYGAVKPSKFFLMNNVLNERTETLTKDDNSKYPHQTLQNPQPLDFSHNSIIYPSSYPKTPLTWIVPKGEYFVMGDNRDNSEDSRFIGFIPMENIVGKAEYIWMALKYNRSGDTIEGVNWKRFFTKLQ